MVSKTHARAGEPRAIGAGDRQGSRPAGLERVQSRKVERARSLFFTCSPDADTATALVSLLDPVVAILPNNNSEDICMAWSSLSKGSFDADAPQVRNLLKALGFQFKPIIDVNDDDAPPAFMAIMPASKARKKSSVILAVYELCNRVLSAPPVTCDGGHTAGDAAKYMAKEACENAVNIAANSSAANNAVNNSAKRGASNVATDVAGQACQLALPDHFNNGETPATNEWGDVAGPTSMALDVVAGPPSPGKPAKRKWGVTLRADTPEFSPLDKKAKEEVVKDKECPMQAMAGQPVAPQMPTDSTEAVMVGDFNDTAITQRGLLARIKPPSHKSRHPRHSPRRSRGQPLCRVMPHSPQAQAQAMRPAQTQQAQTSPLEALVLLPEPALADATAQAQPSVGPSQADNDPLSQPPRARTPDKLLAPAQQPVGLAPQGQQALLPLPPPPPLTLAPRTVVSPHGTQVLTFMPPPPRRMTSQRGALALPRPPAPAPPELASNNVPGNVELGGFPAANGKLGNPDQGCTRRQVHRLCPGTAPRPPKQQWLAREAHQPPQPLPQPQPQPLSQPQPQPRPHPAPWLVAAWDRNGLKPQATTWPSLDAAAPPLWMGDDSSRPPMWTPMRPSLPFQCVRLSEESVEFLYWASRMDIFGIRVTSVTRIQNPHLWDMYVAQRLAMTRKKVGPAGEGEALKPGLAPYNLNESLLYHCSSEPDHKKICLEGLDHRLSAGGRFGHGVYLTDDPRKASNYARGTHRLYVCAVLLGDTLALPDKVASPCDWRREPEKALVDRRRTSDTRFDSVVGRRCRSNGTTGANEFVTYDRFTTCPLYMVEYRGDESGFKRGDDVPWAVRKVPDFAFKYPAPRPSWFCSLLYGHGHGNDGGDPYSPFGCVPPDKPGDDSRWDLFLKSYYQVVAPASAAGMVACASTATAAEVLCAIDDVDDDCIDDGMGFFDESDVRGAVG
eukprot:jgi/Mesvir1/15798/Mv03360-RA.2